jgi:uncharacterized protein
MSYSPDMLVMLVFGLMATGAIVGILAGLLGIGGGIILVPVLFLIYDFLKVPDDIIMHAAVGTSLATIIPTSISSALAHHRRGSIDLRVLCRWSPFIILGAASGGILSHYIESTTLTLIFGCLAIVVAVNMLMSHTPKMRAKLSKTRPVEMVISSFIGFFSALMGIGGGTMSIPVMTAFAMPVHRAIGTSAAFGFMIALPGALGFMWSGWDVATRLPYSLGFINVPAAALLSSVSIFTAPVGSRLAHALDPLRLKRAFALFLILSALRMLYSIFA